MSPLNLIREWRIARLDRRARSLSALLHRLYRQREYELAVTVEDEIHRLFQRRVAVAHKLHAHH